jgi:hypothetical protein
VQVIQKVVHRMLPHNVDWVCSKEHREICRILWISLYFSWFRCGAIRVRYLLKKVMCQFGYVQTILCHPHRSTPTGTSPRPIDPKYPQLLDQVLTLRSDVRQPCSLFMARRFYLHDMVYENIIFIYHCIVTRKSS